MRTLAHPASVRRVESSRVRVVVEIEPGEPVCGSVARDGEPQIPFEGMLAFVSLFERLRTRDPEPAEQDRE
jgi:hypothetical protein